MPAPSKLSPAELTVMKKPGCTAADETLLVASHLEGLASGLKGFGVLRGDVERLERAAIGADGMGDFATGASLRKIAHLLPDVKDTAAARLALAQIAPLKTVTWELGRRCWGHSVTPELMAKVMDLANKVRDGKISRDEAVAEINGQIR